MKNRFRKDKTVSAKFITQIQIEDSPFSDQKKIYIDEVGEINGQSFGFDFELDNRFHTLQIFELFTSSDDFLGNLCLPLPKNTIQINELLKPSGYKFNSNLDEKGYDILHFDIEGLDFQEWSIAHEGKRFWINSFGCGPDEVFDEIPELFESDSTNKSFSPKDIVDDLKDEIIELQEFYLSPEVNSDFQAYVDGDALEGKISKPIFILPDLELVSKQQSINLYHS